MPYNDACQVVRAANIKTETQFSRWKNRPVGVPSRPHKVYAGCGWGNWGKFLGTGRAKGWKKKDFVSYEECARVVRAAGIKTQRQFQSWERPAGIPSQPSQTYKGRGWKNWPEFLANGITPKIAKVVPFDEACRIVRDAGVKTASQFHAWCKANKGIVPSNPDKTYAGKGWVNYPEFLKNGNAGKG